MESKKKEFLIKNVKKDFCYCLHFSFCYKIKTLKGKIFLPRTKILRYCVFSIIFSMSMLKICSENNQNLTFEFSQNIRKNKLSG